MSFETALTGLKAASSELDVTGNNIANSATTGYKASRTEFADIFASSKRGVARTEVGQGVRMADVAQQFTQGQLDFTGNTLDLAINGEGFFRMSDNGAVSYTRDGAFDLDREGYIVDSGGRRLTGFLAGPQGGIGGAVGEMQVNIGNVPPKATTTLDITANLDASAPAMDPAGFDSTDPNTYNFATSTTVYDAQGRDHLATTYFVKNDANPNEWTSVLDVDGTEVGRNVLRFDQNGNFTQVDNTGGPTANYTYTPDGDVADINITADFSTLSQYGSPFDVKDLSQDGFGAGEFSSLGVESDGRILARFTNGQSQTLGQVALSRFPSPQNLQQTGDTTWLQTFKSGAPVTGSPESSGLGSLRGGALEQSNVELTEQLVKMITAQRNFQANSQMISTQDSITQEILNIR